MTNFQVVSRKFSNAAVLKPIRHCSTGHDFPSRDNRDVYVESNSLRDSVRPHR